MNFCKFQSANLRSTNFSWCVANLRAYPSMSHRWSSESRGCLAYRCTVQGNDLGGLSSANYVLNLFLCVVFLHASVVPHISLKLICRETTLTGESRFYISTPQGIWARVPCDRKQTGSPLDQWDMVRMKLDCRLSTGLPPQQRTPWVVKPERGPAASVKPGQKSCVRSIGIITLSARGTSDSLGRSLPQTRPQKWSIMSGSPM
jgi:hypothetical protein